MTFLVYAQNLAELELVELGTYDRRETEQAIRRRTMRRPDRRMFKMNEPASPITIALRVPGQWSHPGDLIQRLPAGYCLTADALTLPDKTQVEFGAMAADAQFAQIFRSSCRQPATADELATVDGYTVNLFLS